MSYIFYPGSSAIIKAAALQVSTAPATRLQKQKRENAQGEGAWRVRSRVERAVVNDFPDLLKSFQVDFPLRASPLDRFYVRLRLLYSLQQKKQARSRMKCSEQQPRL